MLILISTQAVTAANKGILEAIIGASKILFLNKKPIKKTGI
jgi:hypothetical protein